MCLFRSCVLKFFRRKKNPKWLIYMHFGMEILLSMLSLKRVWKIPCSRQILFCSKYLKIKSGKAQTLCVTYRAISAVRFIGLARVIMECVWVRERNVWLPCSKTIGGIFLFGCVLGWSFVHNIASPIELSSSFPYALNGNLRLTAVVFLIRCWSWQETPPKIWRWSVSLPAIYNWPFVETRSWTPSSRLPSLVVVSWDTFCISLL